MRCRTLPAASSPACLWITDDALSEAFNRYLRVSNAHLYHAKRFRSNAPGPLEARRRATRRRMGAAAVASGGAPPPFDMGALFGLGVKPGEDMEKGMRWEGPQLPGPGSDPESRARGWLGPTHWESILQRRHEDDRLAQFLQVPEDPVERSKAAFEALLEAVPAASQIDVADLEPLLAYLQSPENEPEAHLTVRLLDYLHVRSASDDCLSAVVDVVKQKLTLETVTEAEMDVFLRRLRKQDAAVEHLIAVAEALPGEWARRILVAITRQILVSSEDSIRLERLREWLVCLRGCSYVHGFRRHTHCGWEDVYAEISWYSRPSDLADHFSKIQRRRAAMVILQHWVPKLARNPIEGDPKFLDAKVKKKLRFHPAAVEEADTSVLAAELQGLHNLHSIKGAHRKNPLIDLVQVLAERRMPEQPILDEIVSIYMQSEPAAKLRNIIMDLIRRPSVDIATPLATSVIQSFLAADKLEYALQVFDALPTTPLSKTHDLSVRLIERGRMGGERTFKMLNRLVSGDTVPPNEREVRTLSLKQGHIDLVHLVAYAYAKTPHVSARVAFRRVWECFRFLRDRQAPLDPLISRAFVKAGISRPLSEEAKRPSAAQTAYILTIVEKLEGRPMAQKLDEVVFALGKKVAKGDMTAFGPRFRQAQEKRERADASLVRETQFRLRCWRTKGWATKRIRTDSRRSDAVAKLDQREYPFDSHPRRAGDSPETAVFAPLRIDDATESTSQAMPYAPFGSDLKHGFDGEKRLSSQPASSLEFFTGQALRNPSPSDLSAAVRLSPASVKLDVSDPGSKISERSRFQPLRSSEHQSSHPGAIVSLNQADPELTTDAYHPEGDRPATITATHHDQKSTPAQQTDGSARVSQEAQVNLTDGRSERQADAHVSMVDVASASQLAPFQSHDFQNAELIQRDSCPASVQKLSNVNECEAYPDHFHRRDATVIASDEAYSPTGATPLPADSCDQPESQQRFQPVRKAANQRHAKLLKRQQYMRQERRGRAENAAGWLAFAKTAKRRRYLNGYDSWGKRTKVRKEGGSVSSRILNDGWASDKSE